MNDSSGLEQRLAAIEGLLGEILKELRRGNRTTDTAQAAARQATAPAGGPAAPSGAAPAGAPVPAVPIEQSVTPDHLVCLEDGMKLKVLRKHLEEAHGLTPRQYRQKWGLPEDYPMTAPRFTRDHPGGRGRL